MSLIYDRRALLGWSAKRAVYHPLDTLHHHHLLIQLKVGGCITVGETSEKIHLQSVLECPHTQRCLQARHSCATSSARSERSKKDAAFCESAQRMTRVSIRQGTRTSECPRAAVAKSHVRSTPVYGSRVSEHAFNTSVAPEISYLNAFLDDLYVGLKTRLQLLCHLSNTRGEA